MEKFLDTDEDRYILFPIKHSDIWEFYKKSMACFWTPQEIDLQQDIIDWQHLTSGERTFITHILAFFAASDTIVVENLVMNMMHDIKIQEVRCFYGFQIMMENIHTETYGLLIDTLLKDDIEKNKAFTAIQTYEYVKQKATWALDYLKPGNSFVTRLVAFACVEGIFFSSSFCAIFWLKQKGKMPGLTFSNELISRDEGLHTDFACLLYRKFQHQLSEDVVHNIVKHAVEIELAFVRESLLEQLLGMNAALMSQYVRVCADVLLVKLGCSTIYNEKQPFAFMEMISCQGKTNFFEKRVAEYQRSGVMGNEDHVFKTDCNF